MKLNLTNLPIVRTGHDIQFGLTYRYSGNRLVQDDANNPYWHRYMDIYRQPEIGQKYLVVHFCDYDNSEYGENYIVEITEDNILEVTYEMNDTENDISEFILID